MPKSVAKSRYTWMLPQDSAMFIRSSHWPLTQALDRPLLPIAGAAWASRIAVRRPREARWNALLAPTIPAPITTTSKRSMSGRRHDRIVDRPQRVHLRAALLDQHAA